MNNRVAIITGAGRGIGRATAVELAQSEYRLALISRNAGELDETRKICGEEVERFVCDVSDPAKVDRMIDDVLKRFGRIDALVHCAGLGMVRTVEKMTPEEWRATIDTNLSSVFYLCHRLWPVFRKHGGGVVVNVSSYAGRDPFPGLGPYGAAKAGMNLLGLALSAREPRSACAYIRLPPRRQRPPCSAPVFPKSRYHATKCCRPARWRR